MHLVVPLLGRYYGYYLEEKRKHVVYFKEKTISVICCKKKKRNNNKNPEIWKPLKCLRTGKWLIKLTVCIWGPMLRTDTQERGRALPPGKNVEYAAKREECQPFHLHVWFLRHWDLPFVSDREILCFRPSQYNLTLGYR